MTPFFTRTLVRHTPPRAAACLRREVARLATRLVVVLAALAICAGARAGGASGLNNALLVWSSPTTNADGSRLLDLTAFNVYHGTSPTAMMVAATLDGSARSFVDTDLPPGVWYWYVTTVNAFGVESAPSALVSGTIAPPAQARRAPAATPASSTGALPGASTAGTGTAGLSGSPGTGGAPDASGTPGPSGSSGSSGSSGYVAGDTGMSQDPGQHRSLCMPRGMVWCSRH